MSHNESNVRFSNVMKYYRLMELGLEEEGLFRIAAGSSKVKRLRAEFEAGLASPTTMENVSLTIFNKYRYRAFSSLL